MGRSFKTPLSDATSAVRLIKTAPSSGNQERHFRFGHHRRRGSRRGHTRVILFPVQAFSKPPREFKTRPGVRSPRRIRCSIFIAFETRKEEIETQKTRLLKAKRNSVRRSRRSVSLKETDALGRRFARLRNVVYWKSRKISLTTEARRLGIDSMTWPWRYQRIFSNTVGILGVRRRGSIDFSRNIA